MTFLEIDDDFNDNVEASFRLALLPQTSRIL